MSTTGAPYRGIDELFARIKDHDWSISELSLLAIPPALAHAGRVRAIGRRCDDTGEPRDEWEPIPDHEWPDLYIESRRRRIPHYSGDLYWHSLHRRAYAFAQFSEPDLMREWLAPIFVRPRRESVADVVIPSPPKPKPTADGRRPSQAEVNKWMRDRAERERAEHNRPLEKVPAIKKCVADMSAPWRSAEAAWGDLDQQYKYRPGRPKMER